MFKKEWINEHARNLATWNALSAASEKKELELLTVETEASELENEYFKSDEYQELLARRNLDKQFPGENMVIMPENSEEAKTKYKTTSMQATEKDYSNFEKWMMYLFPSY